jgi:hypothetical protein
MQNDPQDHHQPSAQREHVEERVEEIKNVWHSDIAATASYKFHAAGSLDHMIRPLQERLGDRQADRLRRLEVVMTSSNVVGCSMGSSPGLAPLRILST